MKRIFFLLSAFTCIGSLSAQKFRPYHAYGAQINVNSSSLPAEHIGNIGSNKAGEDMRNGKGGFDVFVHYDYGALKWLGVGTGLGYSTRGGSSMEQYSDGSRSLSYLNVPVRLQIKPWHFLWVEAGAEVLYFLNYKDEGNFNSPEVPILENVPFDADGINKLTVSFVPALRFNLFRGLSLNAGYSMGLTKAAEVELSHTANSNVTTSDRSTSYKNFGVFLGVRYMFNQPKKGG